MRITSIIILACCFVAGCIKTTSNNFNLEIQNKSGKNVKIFKMLTDAETTISERNIVQHAVIKKQLPPVTIQFRKPRHYLVQFEDGTVVKSKSGRVPSGYTGNVVLTILKSGKVKTHTFEKN